MVCLCTVCRVSLCELGSLIRIPTPSGNNISETAFSSFAVTLIFCDVVSLFHCPFLCVDVCYSSKQQSGQTFSHG